MPSATSPFALTALAVLIAVTCSPSSVTATFAAGASPPPGVELGRPVSAIRFLAHEDQRRCVSDVHRRKGFWFQPVSQGEAGVAFDQCAIGK